MSKKYVYTRKDTNFVSKFGINLNVYPTTTEKANLAYIEVKKGHLEEFYNKKSYFIYYILDGKGTFYLDGKPYEVKATDVVSIPPNTKIYYIGNMKLLLITTPAFDEKDEVHVRIINEGV